MKNSYLTVTDQFCGAGGSSQGVRNLSRAMGGGVEVKLALNHWKLAIETHNTNFPDTMHECTDISACDPRRYPKTNILITSPECTNHSLAKGKKRMKSGADLFSSINPEEERSRATMWDVPRFAEYHDYEIVIVENVVDARSWVMWDAWLKAMHCLGYMHKCVYLNSMFCHPTPQSRDRLYIVFWKKGNKAPDLEYNPIAWCHKCQKDAPSVQVWRNTEKQWGKYKQQYDYRCTCGTLVEPYYYAAFNCIDWSIPGERIGDRKKPLSPNTMRRAQFGIDKYWDEPQIITTRYTTGLDCRVHSAMDSVMPTQPGDKSYGILNPLIINVLNSQTRKDLSNVVKSAMDKVLSTQTTIGENKGQSKSRSVNERLACVTTKSYHALLSDESWNAFIAQYYNGSHVVSKITEAARTFSTRDRSALIVGRQKPRIEDCYYRMLKDHEVQLGMGFAADYIVLGTSKQVVKQLGNAVTPPAMELLSGRCIASLS